MKKLKFVLLLVIALFLSTLSVSTISAWKNPINLKTYEQETEEFRAVWIASVFNLDIKKQNGTSEQAINEWKAQYLAMLDTAQSYNMNAVVFQIRPANDAFYPSKYNPWSEFLAGYGVNPGWDPLEWMIEVTHERGIEYHAWLNPYRATAATHSVPYSTTDPTTKIKKLVEYDEAALNKNKAIVFQGKEIDGVTNPVFAKGEQLYHNVVLGTEGKYVLNPAAEETVEHLKLTIGEIVDNYEIDGIHFDDYFYPDDSTYGGTNPDFKGLTFSSEPYVDYADYQNYLTTGGDLSIYDWRRSNVSNLIKELSDLIREKNQTKDVKCAFGISPAARWAPSAESCGIRGAEGGMVGTAICNDYYSYSDLYADTYTWAKNEWIDYILPQNYTNLDGNYITIARWWHNALKESKTKLYMGTASYQIDTWGDSLELYYQIRYNQSVGHRVDGYCMYDYTSVTEKKGKAAMGTVQKALWKMDALTPLYAAYTYDDSVIENINAPELIWESENTYTIKLRETDKVKAYVILSYDENEEVDLTKGTREFLKIDTDAQFTIIPTSGKKYVLAAYNESNKLQESYVLLDFPPEPVNEAPVIGNVSEIKPEYLTGESFTFTFTASDTESEELTYTVYIIENNSETVLKTGTITDNTESVTVGPYFWTFKGQIKIVVSDGKKSDEKIYDVSIVDQVTPEPEPTPTPTPKPEKKGCKKKQLESLTLLFSLGLSLILIRKRDE